MLEYVKNFQDLTVMSKNTRWNFSHITEISNYKIVVTLIIL